MARRSVIIKALAALVVLWVVVWGVRTWAGNRRVTMSAVEKEIAKANLEDWSNPEGTYDNAAEIARRESEIRRISGMVNRLDFKERQKNRARPETRQFYDHMTEREKALFFDLTIRETMETFVSALDAMTPEKRKSFVDQAIKDLENNRSEADLKRVRDLGNEMHKASEEGMRAYYSKASAKTKLDLAPLMEAMNEALRAPQQP